MGVHAFSAMWNSFRETDNLAGSDSDEDEDEIVGDRIQVSAEIAMSIVRQGEFGCCGDNNH